MNRRERRAQWLARHRGEAGARGETSARGGADTHAAAHPTHPSAAQSARHAQSHARAGAEGHATDGRASGAAPASVRLHIEEMVLHAFDPRGRYAVADAVQVELTRLLTERGVPPSLGEARGAERLDAGAFDAAPGSRPRALGAQVARSVYGGLKG